MKWRRNGGYYQLRLMRGEDVLEEITGFVKSRRLKSGVLIGLGAASDIELGYYDLHRRQYRKRRFRGEHEIAALVGNIAWDGREPICHIHAVISDRNCLASAGHLFGATVAATCEISLIPGRAKLIRCLEPDTGLKLLQL
ncbi:MAG: PPC domain-containing DNA-binding protein [candidate division WOR-3 bacterium]